MHHMPDKKLREQLRDAARLRHLGLRTEETYWNWIKRFVVFHQKQHPRNLSSEHISQFLTHLAVDGRVAASLSFVWDQRMSSLRGLAARAYDRLPACR